MNPTCEAEIRVINENALRFSIFSKPPPVLEYVKSISSLVGASHILAVFEENDVVKVFFDDKRYVNALMKSGIHVLGHHIRADYVVPPGTKIVLSNIDPVISNCDLMKLLSLYGTAVSPIIRPPISDDTEFCHIGYGLRYVYMMLNGPLPEKLEFKYADQLYSVKLRLGDDSCMIPYIKRDDCDMNSSETESNIVVDVTTQPTVVDAYTLANDSGPVVFSIESEASDASTNDTENAKPEPSETPATRKHKGKLPDSMRLKRAKVTSTSRAARRIRQNVKRKWISGKIRRIKKGKPGRKPKSEQAPLLLPAVSPSTSDVDNSKLSDVDNSKLSDVDNSKLSLSPGEVLDESKMKKVLSDIKLKMFIEEVKNKREPLDIAKKYIGDEYDSDALYCLINQLKVFNSNHSFTSLRIRISRLIKTLRETM